MVNELRLHPVVEWGSYLLVVFGVIDDLINHQGYSFGLILGVFTGRKCARWASEIKKGENKAYLIGFGFFLLGLLAYWLYYEAVKKRVEV